MRILVKMGYFEKLKIDLPLPLIGEFLIFHI